MLAWLIENLATIIICAVLLAVVTLIILNAWMRKKKGKSSCSCGCSGCTMTDTCHPARVPKDTKR